MDAIDASRWMEYSSSPEMDARVGKPIKDHGIENRASLFSDERWSASSLFQQPIDQKVPAVAPRHRSTSCPTLKQDNMGNSWTFSNGDLDDDLLRLTDAFGQKTRIGDVPSQATRVRHAAHLDDHYENTGTGFVEQNVNWTRSSSFGTIERNDLEAPSCNEDYLKRMEPVSSPQHLENNFKDFRGSQSSFQSDRTRYMQDPRTSIPAQSEADSTTTKTYSDEDDNNSHLDERWAYSNKEKSRPSVLNSDQRRRNNDEHDPTNVLYSSSDSKENCLFDTNRDGLNRDNRDSWNSMHNLSPPPSKQSFYNNQPHVSKIMKQQQAPRQEINMKHTQIGFQDQGFPYEAGSMQQSGSFLNSQNNQKHVLQEPWQQGKNLNAATFSPSQGWQNCKQQQQQHPKMWQQQQREDKSNQQQQQHNHQGVPNNNNNNNNNNGLSTVYMNMVVPASSTSTMAGQTMTQTMQTMPLVIPGLGIRTVYIPTDQSLQLSMANPAEAHHISTAINQQQGVFDTSAVLSSMGRNGPMGDLEQQQQQQQQANSSFRKIEPLTTFQMPQQAYAVSGLGVPINDTNPRQANHNQSSQNNQHANPSRRNKQSRGSRSAANHANQSQSQNAQKALAQDIDEGYVYQVKFKRSYRNFVMGSDPAVEVTAGAYVKVEADRGEDLGVVTSKTALEDFVEPTKGKPAKTGGGRGNSLLDAKRILRFATEEEKIQLVEKIREEEQVLRVCRNKVRSRTLPMHVIDAEYQFDRHKLTFFFEADRRIDFRELVRDLFSLYKTRIWLQQIDSRGGDSSGYRGDT